MNFTLLKTIAAEHGDETLDWLRESVDVDAGMIDRRSIKLVLLPRGKLPQVTAALSSMGFDFAHDADFAQIRINDPLTQTVFNQLVQAGVLSADDKAALNVLGTKQSPRWQSLGFDECPQAGDLEYAQTL